MTSLPLRSPVPWMGGKHHMARYILSAFPPKERYDLYCEPFMGGCHVLAQKPAWKHYEAVNDSNGELVNFWLHCRNCPEQLQHRLDTLPYSRQLHYDYHASLFDGTELDPLERAVRWYYVLQGSFSAQVRTTSAAGWKNAPRNIAGRGQPHAFHTALELFAAMAERLRYVEIDHRDFEPVIHQHEKHRTLFYVDPPYLGIEDYYRTHEGTFTLADHERLASALNNTPAMVVLSYYDHPLLRDLYPVSTWRRMTWETFKHSQRTKAHHDPATELLLMNYPAASGLWDACVSA